MCKKAREFQKNIYFCFIDHSKAFHCVNHNKLWKILKEMGITDHLTCILRNLNAGQEATVRTGHRTKDWFQIKKGACQGCILSPCLFNLYAKCWAGWSKTGIKIEKLYFWGAPKSLQLVTEAMKLKENCSLEEKLWPI